MKFARIALPLMLPIAVMGCAQTPPAETTPVAECNAEAVQGLIGQEATQAVTDQAVSRAGARSVRVIRPGQAVTMDYRSDRLNIAVDDGNKITALNCS